MAVHFIHVSKTGGTALRYALRQARTNAEGKLSSPYGPVWAYRHKFRFCDVPKGDKAVFALRDPASRFVSGFYSRLRKGAPRHMREWSEEERRSFEWFRTPQALADALAEPPGETRERAEFALRSIGHLRRPMSFWTGTPSYLRRHLDRVLYVARQETLDDDWERLKELLGLPPEQMLPRDELTAHRTTYTDDRELSEAGKRALRAWYADDYEVLEIGEAVRNGRVPSPGSRLGRLALSARGTPLFKVGRLEHS
ncbi:MAG TPA: sulfotransferase family 2 domain-containing protein [Gaiellaceae bacterium]|nr:sulfotransferase family 2 domain-containing protein [Gaiellaceae bacterium]